MKFLQTFCVLLMLVGSARAEDTAQVLKQSKAATALVVLPEERGSGSGFCIDSSGLFITNAHVVKSLAATESVTLVLSPGEAGERIIRAKVVASDGDRDLALLQTLEGKDFASLALGTVQDLTETQQLTVLGFPFGGALSVKNRKYPNISVNIVHISSLRRSDSQLEAIQVDSQLNPGNSGGPVVDATGKVVGVLSAGIVGGGINFAIPVSDVSTFLSTPRIVFTPPAFSEDNKNAPYDLTVSVVSFDKDKTPLAVQVVINPGTPSEQAVNATSSGAGQFKAHVVPASSKNAGLLRVAITLPDGQIRSSVEDSTVKLDDKEYKLSALSQLEQSASAASIVLRDGTEITGKKLTLGIIKATMAGQVVQVDGAKVEKIIIFASDDENTKPQYKITVKRGDKVVAEETTAIGPAMASARESEPATQASDAILARLEDAKEQYTKTISRAKQQVLDVIEARTEAAANKGDLEAVKAFEAAKQSVEHEGKLPEGIKDTPIIGAQNNYLNAVKGATASLQRAYEQAIRDYTKARKTSDAEAVKAELAERGLTTGSGDNAAAGWIQLGGKAKLPSFLQANDAVYADKDGLRFRGRRYIKTRDAKFLKRDFVLDIIFTFNGKPDTSGITFIGIGEALLGGAYDEPGNSTTLRIHPPDVAGGAIELNKPPASGDILGSIAEPGTHMARIEKKGDSVTFSICRNYEGKFEPDFEKTIPDIKAYAPFLTEKTTFLFFGGGAVFEKIRLTYSPK
jgi:S1-C subfamily serine protease